MSLAPSRPTLEGPSPRDKWVISHACESGNLGSCGDLGMKLEQRERSFVLGGIFRVEFFIFLFHLFNFVLSELGH